MAKKPIINPSDYDTKLSPSEEKDFQEWKAKYAPRDPGTDYDLRGAFKAGLKPDPVSGHWLDTFKKPNHRTFSNESQYAVGDMARYAGHWDGNNFIEPPPYDPKAPPYEERLIRSEDDHQTLGFKTPYGSGTVTRLNAQTPAPVTSSSTRYTPKEIAQNRQAMLNRVRGGTEEQVALRGNEQRNRYRKFLSDRGQDPDTIGTARINRGFNDAGQTASNYYANSLMQETDPVASAYALRQLQAQQTMAPRMDVPSLEQEYDAINAQNQVAGMNNRDSIAARRLAFRSPYDSASLLNQINLGRSMNNPTRSSEISRSRWLERLGGAYDWRNRFSNANGFAGPY